MLHKEITKWIKDYANKNKIEALVVGVSGGIDSAVVSTLCANTKLPTHILTLPIRQNKKLHALSERQATFLQANWANVQSVNIDLTKAFTAFEKSLSDRGFKSELAFANSRSRLRMMALYQVAQSMNGIVVGTGNKVEDFGVGFFTKYGDGGVDISPIADLLKTEVWELGRQLGVPEEIINATPTDGLWDDARTDEDQLGMSYIELEHCMMLDEMKLIPGDKTIAKQLKHYRKLRARNYHKMTAIPIFKKSN